MYIEINTSKKIEELELLFGDKRNDKLYVGVPYAWAYSNGRYLISLHNRNCEEMNEHFIVAENGQSFEMPLFQKLFKTSIVFKPVETRWKDEHRDEGVRWIGRYKGIPIHVTHASTQNFFPYVSRSILADLKPYESLCNFMLRQSDEIKNDVFIKMVMDFVFPEISDWVDGGSKSINLISMFRPEHEKFVEHMLKQCRINNTLGWIEEYIRARNDASIALNSICPNVSEV